MYKHGDIHKYHMDKSIKQHSKGTFQELKLQKFHNKCGKAVQQNKIMLCCDPCSGSREEALTEAMITSGL